MAKSFCFWIYHGELHCPHEAKEAKTAGGPQQGGLIALIGGHVSPDLLHRLQDC